MVRPLLVVMLLFFSAIYAEEAFAQEHVGDLFCSDCSQFNGLGTPLTPDVNNFIRTTVNLYLPLGGWRQPNGVLRTVTICNGSTCVTCRMTASGTLVQITEEFEDDHEPGGYTNDEPPPPPVNPIAGGGGEGGGGGSSSGGSGGGFIGGSGCYGNCDPGGIVEIGEIKPN